MDYSTSINESEDPADSPWGNSPGSSPHHTRTGFEPAAGEAARSTFPYSPQPGGLEASGESDGFQRPGTATTESGTEGGDIEQPAPSGSSVTESANESHAGAAPEGRHAPKPRGEPQAQAPGQSRQAEQTQQQQPPTQQRPQFKLQAKITGLERTGKKDPVLRFDVHVGVP